MILESVYPRLSQDKKNKWRQMIVDIFEHHPASLKPFDASMLTIRNELAFDLQAPFIGVLVAKKNTDNFKSGLFL